jgi:hypothetical protein
MVELSSTEMELKALVADTGAVHSVVAGFEIKVLDGELFPWENVLEFILFLPHQVWVACAH